MRIFVIVVVFDGKKWYDRCFESLRKSEIEFNIIVVDNASTDDTINYIEKNYPEVILVKSKTNIGFGQANNIGLRYALEHDADYVFLLNQDAWIEPDTIKELVNIHRCHDEYGILSPIHLNAKKNSIEKLLLNRIDDYRITDSSLINDMYFNRLKNVYDTLYINAAAWLLPRKTLETVGGFDPIFFHYGEDDNYINRVLYHGMKVGLCPLCNIVHDCNRPRPVYESNEDSILMMIKYTNVNLNTDINEEQKRLVWKKIKSILGFRRKAIENYSKQLRFIRMNKNRIAYSLELNRKKGRTWLYE